MIAIDLVPEMVVLGQEKATQEGVDNIEWVIGRAEEIELERESCDLITAAASFHWMDQQLLARRAFRSLRPGAALAIVGGGGGNIRKSDSPWHKVAVTCADRHIHRRPPSGAGRRGAPPTTDPLESSGLLVEGFEYPTEYTWQLEEFVGYLYAFFSFAPPHVIDDDRREAFEEDLLHSLSDANPSGVFRETLNFNLTVAHKPDA